MVGRPMGGAVRRHDQRAAGGRRRLPLVVRIPPRGCASEGVHLRNVHEQLRAARQRTRPEHVGLQKRGRGNRAMTLASQIFTLISIDGSPEVMKIDEVGLEKVLAEYVAERRSTTDLRKAAEAALELWDSLDDDFTGL